MAESVLGSLGGFMRGRVAGNRNLDASVDRLERTVNEFADVLQRLTGTLGAANAGSNGGYRASGSTVGNGGHAPTSHRAEGEPRWTGGGGYEGQRSNGGGWSFGGAGVGGWSGGPGGGEHSAGAHSGGYGQMASSYASQAYQGLGGRAGIARKGMFLAGAGIATYTANHYESQVIEQSIASQYSYGPNWSQAYRSLFAGNYTSVNPADRQRAANMIGASYGVGAAGQGMRAAGESLSFANPAISNTQAATAGLALGQVGTFNRLQVLGINAQSRRGNADVWSLARQVLARMPGSANVRSEGQITAAFMPSGSVTVTVNNMVANGFIPAQSREAVLEAIRSILRGQIQGMGYGELRQNLNTARSQGNTTAGDQARENLRNVGIGGSLIQGQRTREGMSHESEVSTINGFVNGVRTSTEVLKNFRGALNNLLEGPLGPFVGSWSGTGGTLGSVLKGLPFIGKNFNKIPGIGGSAPTMSQVGFGMGSMMTSAQSGVGAFGGTSNARQSRGGAGSGASGNLHLIAPRPGINHMSSEQDFGTRTIGQGWHTGIDLEGSVGSPIRAAASGVITGAGWGASGDGGYGNTVMQNIGNGYVLMYAHMSSITVKRGQRVRQGQIIGHVGNTGAYSRGSHLHFEVHKNGKPINPEPFLRGRGINAGGVGGGSAGGSAGGGGGGGGSVAGQSDPTGTTGQTLGQTGGYMIAGQMDTYSAYSEVAALGLGANGVLSGGSGLPGAGSQAPVAGGRTSGGGGGFSGSGAAGTVRTGTFNLLHSTSARATQSALTRLMRQADVLSLQEIESAKARQGLGAWLGRQGWGYYKGRGDSAVTWDKKDFTAVRQGDQLMNTLTGEKGGTRRRYASYVLLKDNDTGALHWEVAAHTVPNAKSQRVRQQILNQQFNALGKLADRLEKTAPVILAGDLNQTRGGKYWNQAALRGLQTHSRGIDHVLFDPSNAKLLGQHVASGGASDHNAVLATIRLLGSQGGGGGSVKGNGGSASQNIALGRAMAAQRGWTGSQWDALRTLWMHESGWRTHADNPTSSAYGIPQALTAMHHLGASYKNNPKNQITWGLNYIKSRYGNPAKAWSFWQRHHWYDSGEWDIRDDQDARVHKGEMILPTKVAEAVRAELSAPGHRNNRGAPSTGAGIVFEKGSIQVNLGGVPTTGEATLAGQQIVDAVVGDRRIRELAGER